MKGLIRFLARLYPRRWRVRYGAEFEALIEDSSLSAGTALNILTGALVMQLRFARKAACGIFMAAILISAWFAGRHPYISLGNGLVLRQDSDLGAMVTMLMVLVLLIFVLTALVQLVCGKFRRAGKTVLIGVATMAAYSAVVSLISVMTPRTIVSVGDGYFYDLWCVGVQRVDKASAGPDCDL